MNWNLEHRELVVETWREQLVASVSPAWKEVVSGECGSEWGNLG